MQRRQLAQQLGQDFDASLLDDRLLRDSALGSLIDRMLLLQSAKDANFAFSSEALDQLILQTPEFQVDGARSEEHPSELRSLMRISYSVLCLKKKNNN